MTRKEFLQAAAGLGLSAALPVGARAETPARRPNIVWLSCEDIGPHLGCYGDPLAVTPTLDKLASEGVRYTNAFTTAPVCAPNRCSVITGVHAATLGAHHMRSGAEGAKMPDKPALPPEVRCFSQYLRDAGYYCTNNEKQDYNFITPKESWDESSNRAHWRNRPRPDQPFFAVFNYVGTHESCIRATPEQHAHRTAKLRPDQRQDPARITPPPFHPDTPVVRRQWANYYECVTALDYWAADLLDQLREDGLADNTIVFFWSDHGPGLTRCKRWVYDSGTHVPVIVRIPEALRAQGQGKPGSVDEQLVSSADFAPTVMNLVGLPIPKPMQGRPFLGAALPPEREYVYAARDRMDERYDLIRMVRDKRYQYIRNYEPFRPYDQFMDYEEQSPVKQEMHRLEKEGKLAGPAAWIMLKSKPVEELYDTQTDPFEIKNVIDDQELRPVLERLRTEHERWFRASNDLGWIPEPELVTLGERYGTRYAILPGLNKDDPGFRARLKSIVTVAGRPQSSDRAALVEALSSPHAAMRYWAAIGLGNLKPADTESLAKSLGDASSTVRVAAARWSLAAGASEDKALATLTGAFRDPNSWVRFQAALALDEVGEKARPAIPAMEDALKDTDNKYIVRVTTHALNALQGKPLVPSS